MVAGHQLRLRLGQIERHAVRLGERGDEEDEEEEEAEGFEEEELEDEDADEDLDEDEDEDEDDDDEDEEDEFDDPDDDDDDFDDDGTWDIGGLKYDQASPLASADLPSWLTAEGDATRNVRAAIVDRDGGFRTYAASVTVENVAPTATFTGDTVVEGTPATVSHMLETVLARCPVDKLAVSARVVFSLFPR